MAETNQEVAERVRQELTGRPELGTNQLWDIGKEMDPSLGELSVQQFHGRYVLPVKRDLASQREGSGEERPRKQSRAKKQDKKQDKAGGRASKRAAKETAAEEQPAAAADSKPGRKATKSPRKRARAAADQPQEAAAGPAQEQAKETQRNGREHVRAVFLQFARDFAEAESRTEIVQVLAKLDEYVDRVLQHG